MLTRFAPFRGTLVGLTAVGILLAGCGGATEVQRPGTPGSATPKPVEAKLLLRDAPLDDDPLTSPRTEWFRQGKFGMFIHWGVYAVPAGVYQGKEVGGLGEWIMDKAKIPVPEYEKFARQFNPTRFDAREWVRLAKEAGMTYMVITSKHHDGFCLWDSKHTAYDIIDTTPFARDPLKELAHACREAGITLCFYHSIMDWHHPDAGGEAFPRYREHLKAQVKELIAGYGPLGILWFDGEWIKEWDEAQGADLYRFCRTLQPSLMVNNRVGKRKSTDGDYETPEQDIPAGAIKGRLWETCMTMNDTWGFKTNDQNWKSTTDLLRKLIDIASKGGNFLLNVGPTAEGLIPEPSRLAYHERLPEAITDVWLLYGAFFRVVGVCEGMFHAVRVREGGAHGTPWGDRYDDVEDLGVVVAGAKAAEADAFAAALFGLDISARAVMTTAEERLGPWDKMVVLEAGRYGLEG